MTRMILRVSLCLSFVTLVAGAPDALHAATPESVNSACTLSAGIMKSTAFFWTPPEELKEAAWKIPVSTCTACAASGAIQVTNVTFGLRWFKACSATAQVLVVGAHTVNGCLAPDTTQVLCAPATFAIASPSNSVQLHSLSITNANCISGDAFLVVRFSGLGSCSIPGFGPGLTSSSAACTACEQYTTAAGIFPTSTEWCSIGATSEMWFSIAADCCQPVPAVRQSWGAVKSTYR